MREALLDESRKVHLPKYVWPRLLVIGIVSFAIGGTSFLWGTRAVYIASYFIQGNPSMTVENVLIMQSIQVFASNFGVAIGNTSLRLAGSVRKVFIYLAIVFAATSFPMLLINNFWWVLLLRIIMGLAMGVAWYQPMGLAWGTFPNKKGLLYGIFSAANFFALILFSQLTMMIVNPDNALPNGQYFPPEVYSNVPKMFNILGGIYVVLLLLAAICAFDQKRMGNLSNVDEMINEPQLFDEDGNIQAAKRLSSFQAFQSTLKCPRLWMLAIMLLFAMIGPAILLNNFKVYGFEMKFDDLKLTLLFNVITATLPFQKLFTPILAEKIGNRKLVAIVLVLNIINAILLKTTTQTNIWYYGLVSGISTLSYHTMWTISVTYPSAEFPKETQPMIISLLGVFMSAGDIGSQSFLVLGLSFSQIFLLGLILGVIALFLLIFLEDGTILTGKKLPDKKAILTFKASEVSVSDDRSSEGTRI